MPRARGRGRSLFFRDESAFALRVLRAKRIGTMEEPVQLADLLTPRGRRVLEGGRLAGVLKTGTRFIAEHGLLDRAKCEALLARLERETKLRRMERGIPRESIWGLRRNYEEQLPKTVRCFTAHRLGRTARS